MAVSRPLASDSEDKQLRVYALGDGSAPGLEYTLDDAKNDVSWMAFSGD